MLSLVFGDSHAPSRQGRARGSRIDLRQRAAGLAWAFGLCGSVLGGALFGCGGDSSDPKTVVLADSGNLAALTNRNLDIPTTVAVRTEASGEVAWVAESQFDHYAPFGGVGNPGAFRLVGVPLVNGSAAQTIALPANFFPEGITASAGGRLYVGSIADGSIYTVAPNATTAEQFLAAKTLAKPSVVGMALNPSDPTILWVCNTVTSPPMGELPSAAIVGIGAGDRQIKAIHELPASSVGAFCNDIAISKNGTLWATESFGGRLFRIPQAELLTNGPAKAWLQASELAGPDGPTIGVFGANGLALVSGKLFVVNSSRGTLLSIDPTLTEPASGDLKRVELKEGDTGGVVLANPDGISALSDTELLVVENGFFVDPDGKVVDRGGKRLARVSLDTQ